MVAGTVCGEGDGFRPVPVQKLSGVQAWNGFQFLQADARGHVFVLNGETLELFDVDSTGDLRKKSVLERKSGSPSVAAWEAAMSPSGDWLLWQPPNELRYFRSGEEVQIPATAWAVSALGVLQGSPILGVLPASVGAPAATADPRDELTPVILSADDSAWKILVARKPFERENRKAGLMQEVHTACDVHLATSSDGTFWLASQNAYLLKEYAATGKAKDEVRVGEGKVRWVDRSDKDWKEIEKAAQSQGRGFERSNFAPVRGVLVNRAITVSRDGRVYLLVETDDGLALDRYDSTALTLERVLLRSIDPGPGRLNLAAGQDGLYIGGRTGAAGRWRVAWETLDQAPWRPVPNAERNGMALNAEPLAPAKAAPKATASAPPPRRPAAGRSAGGRWRGRRLRAAALPRPR